MYSFPLIHSGSAWRLSYYCWTSGDNQRSKRFETSYRWPDRGMVKQGVTKIMETVMPFGEVLEAVDKLSLEEQEALIAVLHRRLIERRREELAKDMQHAQQEFEAGQCRPVTPAELMKEIGS